MPDHTEWIESIEQLAGNADGASENTALSKVVDHLKGDLGSSRLTAGEIDRLAAELIQISISNPEEGQENQDED